MQFVKGACGLLYCAIIKSVIAVIDTQLVFGPFQWNRIHSVCFCFELCGLIDWFMQYYPE